MSAAPGERNLPVFSGRPRPSESGGNSALGNPQLSPLPLPARHQHRIVEVEQDAGVVAAIGGLAGKTGAGLILGRDATWAQRSQIVASRQRELVDHFRPGVDGIAGKGRHDTSATIDRGNPEGIGQAVERQRTRETDDVSAIDEAAAKATSLLGLLIEVYPRGILVQAGDHHVLALLVGHAVNMIDALPHLIIAPQVGTA